MPHSPLKILLLCHEYPPVGGGDTALLVQPRSALGLRDAVLELTQDPDRCLQMGRRARERGLGSFEAASNADRHIDLLRPAIERSGK